MKISRDMKKISLVKTDRTCESKTDVVKLRSLGIIHRTKSHPSEKEEVERQSKINKQIIC